MEPKEPIEAVPRIIQKSKSSMSENKKAPKINQISNPKNDTNECFIGRHEDIPNMQMTNLKYKKRSYQLSTKDKIQNFMNRRFTKIVDILITLWALFADDIKMLTTTKNEDIFFSCFSIFTMIIFLIEIVFSFIVYEDDYGCGVYFWIDLLGLFSMITDVHWISEMFMNRMFGNDVLYNKDRGQSIIHLTRGVRILTRATRIARIIRILKLFKIASGKTFGGLNAKEEAEIDFKNFQEESQVEHKFEELTLKRILVLVFLMILAIIFFDPNFFYQETNSVNFGLSIFQYFPETQNELKNFTFNMYIKNQMTTAMPIIHAKVYNFTYTSTSINSNDLRIIEKIEAVALCRTYGQPLSQNTIEEEYCSVIFDNRQQIRLQSIMSIIRTICICVILLLGIIGLSFATHELAIAPIQKMAMKIKNLSKNPIAALQQNMDIDNAETSISKKKALCNFFQKKHDAPLETILLEKTVTKICALLALGFGEAGAEIISTVMNVGIEAEMNPMIPGKKVMAIYGFCDIRNFTDTTEVLQEKVMIFVNEVAEIVHEITSDFKGSANKNIGDAFLLVWKIEDKFVEHIDGELKLKQCREVNQIVDMALIAFIKIIIQIRRSSKLGEYSKHERLNERMPNYSVKLGFGMHLGYSIEGAIGSMFKIDASYLSPNVNMASSMEERTKEYGKDIILSGEFVKYLSEEARKCVRQLDQISHESAPDHILKLYTVDLDLKVIDRENEKGQKMKFEDLNQKMEMIKAKREKTKNLYNDIIKNKINIWTDFEQNPDFMAVRAKYKKEFFDNYKLGFDCYLKGEWIAAKNYLESAITSVGGNELSLETLLKFMEHREFKAGLDWRGVRENEGTGH